VRAVRRVWFTAVGFAVGSALFALGTVFAVSSGASAELAGWTYFVGSVFFTTAGLLQFVSSREADRPPQREHTGRRRFEALRRPRSMDWTASAIQLVGTVLFNVNTFRAATLVDPSATEVNRLIWAPDALGSVAFLVSSGIAFAPEVRWRRHRHRRDRSWAIGALNLLGSIFFGLSAIGALVLPESDALVNESWSNGGTFLGAVCFFIGAVLLVPRWPFGRSSSLV
jgi:hypothetical protein